MTLSVRRSAENRAGVKEQSFSLCGLYGQPATETVVGSQCIKHVWFTFLDVGLNGIPGSAVSRCDKFQLETRHISNTVSSVLTKIAPLA